MAGWSNDQTSSGFVVSNTVKSLAFPSSVVAGQVIVAASVNEGANTTDTWTDLSSNVSTWHANDFAAPESLSIAWGLATTSGPCTPQVTWGSSGPIEIYIGSFNPPGTVSADGAEVALADSTPTSTIVDAAGGTGTNDLIVSVTQSGAYSSLGGTWQLMGAVQSLDGAFYDLNVAGNTASAINLSPATSYEILIVALSAPDIQILRPTSDIATTGWTPSTGPTLYGVVGDNSDTTYATATPS